MYSLNDRLKYYDFVIETDKKFVFEYGFKLTEKEKNIIRERIKKLKADTVPWSSPYDYTYAHKLETTMNAKFYKFKSGKFKKYYSTRNNCVLLVDIIIKDILIDKIESGSFVIPGNYMFYFDFLSKLKNSKIVSKKIYT
jgi:mRNA-degrading endonuclease RelE of RelBE toxin-antitoxin system